MKASPNPTTVVLFDETSIYHSDTSLVSFMFFQQATIVGQGLLPGDEISFEILRVEPGKMPRVNGACCIAEGKLPTIIGVEPLTCRDCDCDEEFSLVRMTHKNPVVILDAPQGVLLRARYTAKGGTSNIGNFTVKALIETATRTVPRGMNGCLPKEPPPEYFATMCLPCGGLAFRPEYADPDATVALEDCDGAVLGYVYPKPRKGATTEVFEGCGCENENLIGFAVNDVDKICGGCPEMTVQPMPVPHPPPPPPPPPPPHPPPPQSYGTLRMGFDTPPNDDVTVVATDMTAEPKLFGLYMNKATGTLTYKKKEGVTETQQYDNEPLSLIYEISSIDGTDAVVFEGGFEFAHVTAPGGLRLSKEGFNGDPEGYALMTGCGSVLRLYESSADPHTAATLQVPAFSGDLWILDDPQMPRDGVSEVKLNLDGQPTELPHEYWPKLSVSGKSVDLSVRRKDGESSQAYVTVMLLPTGSAAPLQYTFTGDHLKVLTEDKTC